MSGRRSRSKGAQVERSIVNALKATGIAALYTNVIRLLYPLVITNTRLEKESDILDRSIGSLN